MRILVMGAGLVGAPIAIDLAKDPDLEVSIADKSAKALEKLRGQDQLETIEADLSDGEKVTSLAAGFDMVVSAVPGFMGYRTLESVIKAGKDVVDIAFFPEEPFALDGLAREKGVTAVFDCGVAPGMSNLLAGHADYLLDETASILIYVGGLPVTREWPFEYKAPFSPIDVIEEYIRPARYVEKGRVVVRPALSEPELIDFPGIGTLEAFNTDGLRSLAATMDAPDMKEKTLRYPGHIDRMRMLRETGFFSYDEIEIAGAKIRPIDLTARILFPKWEYSSGEADITVMQIRVEGVKDGRKLCYKYDLVDRYDPGTDTLSMARTTGYTATMAVRMLSAGLFAEKGIIAPEKIGRSPECVDFMLKGLEDRGVVYRETVEELS